MPVVQAHVTRVVCFGACALSLVTTGCSQGEISDGHSGYAREVDAPSGVAGSVAKQPPVTLPFPGNAGNGSDVGAAAGGSALPTPPSAAGASGGAIAGRNASTGGGGAGAVAGGTDGSAGHAGSGPGAAGRSGGAGGRAGDGAAGSGGAGDRGGSVPPGAHATYYVQDGQLYDSCGEKVVLRGINHPTLYVDRKGAALPEIAKTGANSVRLFWYATRGIAISEAEPAIKASIANGMLPILEMHDSTCAFDLDGIVAYWTSAEAVALIQRYQAQLIVNIANEPRPTSADQFESKFKSVVDTLRKAGIHTPLMLDGGNCGRDYSLLLDRGQALLSADPEHNLIFSAHLYDPMSAMAYGQVFDKAIAQKLAFVIGEFANRQPPGCGAAIDYKSMIAEANKRGIGWLAWSWGNDDPNTDWNSDCREFDMTTTFSFDSLTGWGKEVSVTLPESIQNTSVRPTLLTTGACL